MEANKRVGMKFKTLIKFFLERFYQPLLLRYLRRDRHYRYKSINILVKPGVFHPGLFFSTELLLKHIAAFEFSDKKFLELGAGSGLIAIFAAQRGAWVTASDISATAVENVRFNARQNGVEITAIESDLFDRIPLQIFDIIIINPPYYPNNPKQESEYAWFCGDTFQFFEKLFTQMDVYVDQHSNVRMILSEDCQIEHIRKIARNHGFLMKLIFEKRILWEMNYIYVIEVLPAV
jgi:release factor glutamine methyltransferase